MMIAESLPQLVSNNGEATAIGVWMLMAIVAGGAGLLIYNQILAAQVNRKVLKSPIASAAINPQPFIVAMEKEFVHRRDYEEKQSEVRMQLKEVRAYAHDEVHNVRGDLQAMRLASEERDQLLHKLDERSINQGRVIEGMSQKIDRIVDRMSDKIEEIFKRRDERSDR